MRHLRLIFAVAIASSLVFTLAIAPNPASAAEVTVTTCTRAGLATAISGAAAGDTITFDCPDPTIDFYAGQSIRITKLLTIDGSNNGNPIILDGNNQTNFFEINLANDNQGRRINISNMTMQNGNGGEGGAIDINDENDPAVLVITSVTFANNQALFGGAIYNEALLQVHQSTFTNNSALVGGAIYNFSTMEITQSSFVENHALSAGAIAFASSYAGFVTSSTFSGNTADHLGSTISIFAPPHPSDDPETTMRWSTIVQPSNTVPALYVEDDHSVNLEGVIIGGKGQHCSTDSGTITASYTLANDDSCGQISSGITLNQQLLVGPALTTDLYGTTQTYHPLLNGGPAIDGGPATCETDPFFSGDENGMPGAPDADQLGTSRPINGLCDIGAIEGITLNPTFLCANTWNGAIRVADNCSRSETQVIMPIDGPITLCVNQWNGATRLGSNCSRSEQIITATGDNTIPACVNGWNGTLRITDRCTRSETPHLL